MKSAPKHFAAAMALLALTAVLAATPALGATCLTGECHRGLTAVKYLHGPVAAETARSGGCAMCHLPAGAPCSVTEGGSYHLPAGDLCLACHDKGTGSQHSTARTDCLSCHDPHGSQSSPFMLRAND